MASFEGPEENPAKTENPEVITSRVCNTLDQQHAQNNAEKEYHGIAHPESVFQIAERPLAIIAKYNEGIDLTAIKTALPPAAKGHDGILLSRENEQGKLERYRGFNLSVDAIPDTIEGIDIHEVDVTREEIVQKIGNEAASDVRIIQTVRREDPQGLVYTPEVQLHIWQMVAGTYPEVPYPFPAIPEGAEYIRDPETGEMVDVSKCLIVDEDGTKRALKIDQPFVTEDSDLGTLALAIGDLSAVGVLSPEEFKKTGLGELHETNPRIKRELQDKESLSVERKIEIVEELLAWPKSQVGFALWQKLRFETLLDTNEALNALPNADATKEALKKEFGNFDRNIIASAQWYEKLQQTYGALLSDEGYADPELFSQFVHEEMGFAE